MTQQFVIEAEDLLESPDNTPIYLATKKGYAKSLTTFNTSDKLFQGNIFEAATRIAQELEYDRENPVSYTTQWQYTAIPASAPLLIKDTK